MAVERVFSLRGSPYVSSVHKFHSSSLLPFHDRTDLFSDCLTRKVCRKQRQTPSNSTATVFEKDQTLGTRGSSKIRFAVEDRGRRVQDLNSRTCRFNRKVVNWSKIMSEVRGQSSRCLRGPTRERWERRASGVPWASRQLWHTYVSGTWLLRILAHDRWIHVLHLLHSIMALPAKGFMQKHVTRSHESSSEKTTYSIWHHGCFSIPMESVALQGLTRVHHYVFILSRAVFVPEHDLLTLPEHGSVSRKSLHLLYLYHSFLEVSTIPRVVLLLGLLFAGGRARQACGMEGNADVVLGLLFDHPSTEGQ